ncbi:MAG: def1 [Gammaproteobacteria bacterium]|jgi:peptide deformylase|nr:def1 [Gammaproteobacteria bacterium]
MVQVLYNHNSLRREKLLGGETEANIITVHHLDINLLQLRRFLKTGGPMATFKILQYPDPKLRRKGHHVTEIDARISKIIDDMFETHYSTKNCAALAATQLDMPDPPHITVIDFSDQKNSPLCLVNGEIIASAGEYELEEGCMSIAGAYEKVKRAEKITVSAMDKHGKPFTFEADGFMAKCVQHELDHLDGKVFLDHLSALKRGRIDKRITKMLRQSARST